MLQVTWLSSRTLSKIECLPRQTYEKFYLKTFFQAHKDKEKELINRYKDFFLIILAIRFVFILIFTNYHTLVKKKKIRIMSYREYREERTTPQGTKARLYAGKLSVRSS